MARKRMLDPKIWDSEQVMSLNSDQFKVYIYLISQADDAGRIKISFPLLKSRVFPFGMKPQGGLTEDSGLIWKVLELLNSTKLIKLYRDKEGSLYAHQSCQTLPGPRQLHPAPHPLWLAVARSRL